MSNLVLDANVAIAWFSELNESDTSESLLQVYKQIRKGEVNAFVPSFFLIEVAHVCLSKKHFSVEHVEKTIDLLSNLGITTVSFDQLQLKEIVRLAADTHLSIYDAQYLYLAKSQSCSVITLDQAMIRADASCMTPRALMVK